jgi:hypothetical protein
MTKKRPDRTRAAHVRELLTGSPAVMYCLEQQRAEDRVLARVRDLLAPGARAHCIQASNNDGELTVTVDSAAWATRLRYLAPDLAQSLAWSGVTAVQIRARPRERNPLRQTAERLPKLAPAVVEHLTAAADHMADAGIAEVLRRLAARHRGGD